MFRVRYRLWSIIVLVMLAAPLAAQDQIPWLTDLRQARQMAEQNQRLVLLHFWSDNCLPCRALEQNVFNQPELIRALATNYVPVKINVMQQSRYADYYKIERVPTDVIVDVSGKELFRRTSPSSVDSYLAMLDQVRASYATHGSRAAELLAAAPGPAPYASPFPARNDQSPNSPYADSPSESINANPVLDLGTLPNRGTNSSAADVQPPQRTVVQNQFVSASSPLDSHTNIAAHPESTDGTARTQGPTPAGPDIPPPFDASNYSPAVNGGMPPGTSYNYAAPRTPDRNLAGPTAQPPTMPPAGSMQSLPPNVPPLAMDGFCPVTLVGMTKWAKGDPRWGAVHRGRTYLLASQAEQQLFLKEPDRFSPALSGYDPVRFAESHQLVDGRREYGVFFAGTYYLFADEAALLKFESQPHGYVNVVRQAMANTALPGAQR